MIFQPNCPGIWQNRHQQRKETGENKVMENEWEGRGETEKVTPDLQSHAEMPGMIKPSLSDGLL